MEKFKRWMLLGIFCCPLVVHSQVILQENTRLQQLPEQQATTGKANTRYLFIVTIDGFRWQEVFTGADSTLLFDPVSQALDTANVAAGFWAATPEARRSALLPFIWSTFAGEGQLYGNRHYGNKMNVSNFWAFSYPGYNELFTGRADNWRIYSNRKIYNPNKNVLEFFQQEERLRNKVAVFSSWDAFPYILHAKRAGMPVSSGKDNRKPRIFNQFIPPGKLDDPFTWAAAMDYLRNDRPYVLYMALNATDLLGHAGNYPAYLGAAHQIDQYLAQLWNFLQQDSVYAGKSTLLVTTDHGRGSGTMARWMQHNRHLSGSKQVWLGVIGPDTPPLGELRRPMQVWQKQFAQTLARFQGLEFRRGRKVAPAILSAFQGL